MIHNPALAQEFSATVGEFARHRDDYFRLVEGLGSAPVNAETDLTDVLRQSLSGGGLLEHYDYPPDAKEFVLWGTWPEDVREGHLRLARYRRESDDVPEGVTTLAVTASGDNLEMATREYVFDHDIPQLPSLGYVRPVGDAAPVEADGPGTPSTISEFTAVLGAMRRANQELSDPQSILSMDLREFTGYRTGSL